MINFILLSVNKVIQLGENKIIRDACCLYNEPLLAILTNLDICVYDCLEWELRAVLKRVAYPRAMVAIRKKSLLLVQYSDNIAVVYSYCGGVFEQVYTILGMSSSTKKIECSQYGTHLLYGDNVNLQMWDIAHSRLCLFLSTLKNVNCYCLSPPATDLYCGTYTGSLKKKNYRINKRMINI